MRIIVLVLFTIGIFGCVLEQRPQPDERIAASVEQLGINVDDSLRGFVLSDKRGGYILRSSPQQGDGDLGFSFYLFADMIVRSPRLAIEGKSISWTGSQVRIFPHRVEYISRGDTINISLLRLPHTGVHAFEITVRCDTVKEIAYSVEAVKGGRMASVSITSDRKTLPANKEMILRESTARLTTVVDFSTEVNPRDIHMLGLETQKLTLAHLDEILNRSYFSSSDENLTRAVRWSQLMLDGFLVVGKDTSAITSFPAASAIDVRSLAQSIAPFTLALGNPVEIRPIVSRIAEWQDRRPESPTFGRLPSFWTENKMGYSSADVTSIFIRQLYDYILATNDTALARTLFPFIQRSIDGPLQNSADSTGLMRHGPSETWTSSFGNMKRNNRAIEVQSHWYFHQFIGALLASFFYDSTLAEKWSSGASKTMASINDLFVDTLSLRVHDNIRPSGVPENNTLPNALFAFEVIRSELHRKKMAEHIMETSVTPLGVTVPFHKTQKVVAVSLQSEMVQVLSRFDREDLAYRTTENLTKQLLTRGVAGSLPEFLPLGRDQFLQNPSLLSTAEYLRSVYKSYLGVTVDASSHRLALLPALPQEMSEVDFTVFLIDQPVHISYSNSTEGFRLGLHAPDAGNAYDVSFVAILRSGDGWSGSVVLEDNKPVLVVMTPDRLIAFRGEDNIEIKDATYLSQYSRRNMFDGFRFAPSQ